ncbi:hypothetical protein [Variovorax paradoxus]|jgi:hypothetical protein|uniref:hypothetical protein n=1 Tax=Variovorax paradoxus TaxID=34073 RepID=UPI0024810D38|nr:hypothetical protein [Variovorax paradoxus]WGT64502.1 hypothetical protein QHG62_03950 [Variovorax paradoxus]
MDDPPFNSNGTLGRLVTFQVPKGPMVRRPPDACTAPYERAKADFENQPWYVRWTSGTDRPVGAEPTDAMGRAKQFREECQKWPDEIPQSMIDDKRQQLTDHVTGKSPLPPEESLRVRRDLDFLEDVYNPGPRWQSTLSPQEQAWLDERNLRWGNTMGIAFLGPIYGGPGALTRLLGGSEQAVAGVNQLSGSLVGIGRTRTFERLAAERRAAAIEALGKSREMNRGAPLQPLDPAGAARAGTVIRRKYAPLDWDAVVPKKGPYKGEKREDHVRRHNQDVPGKDEHGVFYKDGVATTNQAWERAQDLGIKPDASGTLRVPMGEIVGRAGGAASATGELFRSVEIKLVPGTNQIITSYPVK